MSQKTINVSAEKAPVRTQAGSNAGTRPLKAEPCVTGKNSGYSKIGKRAGVKEF